MGKIQLFGGVWRRITLTTLHLYATENGTLHQSQQWIKEVLSATYSKMFYLYVLTHEMSFYKQIKTQLRFIWAWVYKRACPFIGP